MSRTAQQKRPVVVEEDVDDLDDVLEQFSTPSKPSFTATPSKPTSPSTLPNASSSASKRSAAPAQPRPPPAHAKPDASPSDLNLPSDFASELAKGMAELMREIAAEASPNVEGAPTGGDKQDEQKFRKAWEDMLVGEMNGLTGIDEMLAKDAPGKEKGKAKEDQKVGPQKKGFGQNDFQQSIKKAMEKMKESDTNLQAESTASNDDPLEALLSSLGEGGGESEEELQGILESMMSQLMSKEVLYEPLKELHDKFPAYLRDNAAKIKPEDKTRYEAQQVIVTQIIGLFEAPNYSDEDTAQGVKIVGLMNEMQVQGSPPTEIMGPLPPGLDMGPDGLPKLPDGCSIM